MSHSTENALLQVESLRWFWNDVEICICLRPYIVATFIKMYSALPLRIFSLAYYGRLDLEPCCCGYQHLWLIHFKWRKLTLQINFVKMNIESPIVQQ